MTIRETALSGWYFDGVYIKYGRLPAGPLNLYCCHIPLRARASDKDGKRRTETKRTRLPKMAKLLGCLNILVYLLVEMDEGKCILPLLERTVAISYLR